MTENFFKKPSKSISNVPVNINSTKKRMSHGT